MEAGPDVQLDLNLPDGQSHLENTWSCHCGCCCGSNPVRGEPEWKKSKRLVDDTPGIPVILKRYHDMLFLLGLFGGVVTQPLCSQKQYPCQCMLVSKRMVSYLY